MLQGRLKPCQLHSPFCCYSRNHQFSASTSQVGREGVPDALSDIFKFLVWDGVALPVIIWRVPTSRLPPSLCITIDYSD